MVFLRTVLLTALLSGAWGASNAHTKASNAMNRLLRVILVWVMALTVPAQAMASVVMAACGTNHRATAQLRAAAAMSFSSVSVIVNTPRLRRAEI